MFKESSLWKKKPLAPSTVSIDSLQVNTLETVLNLDKFLNNRFL